MKRTFQWIITALFLALVLPVTAQQTPEKFIQETQYLLYLPQDYTRDSSQRWPLLVFLHGSGESGTDLAKVKVHGPPKLIEKGRQFPFIVVSPQATNGWKADQLMGMINDIKKKYRVDQERVYLTGLSMGGFGSWNLATEYPGEFAAIAPICGGGDSSKVWALRYMPVWCFHGAKDNVVPLSASQQMISALRVYNPGAKFTIYPEANHDSWTVTYDNDSLYTWLLSQKRYRHAEKPHSPGSFDVYAGQYLNNDNDTVRLVSRNDSLLLDLSGGRQRTMVLKLSGPDIFYFDPATLDEIRFTRNRKNAVEGFYYLGNRERIQFNRLPESKTSKQKTINTKQ